MMKKMCVYTVEYSAIKKKKGNAAFATTWLDLKVIVLSKISQRKKIFYVLTYMWTLKYPDSNSRIVGTGGWEIMGDMVKGYKLPFKS